MYPEYAEQETPYWCFPAAVSMHLSKMGFLYPQQEVMNEIYGGDSHEDHGVELSLANWYCEVFLAMCEGHNVQGA